MNTLDVAKAYIVLGGIASRSAAVLITHSLLTPDATALSMPGSTRLVPIHAVMLKRTKLTGIRQRATAFPVALTPGMAAP